MAPAPEHPIWRGEHVWLRPLEKEDVLDGPIDDVEFAHYSGFQRTFARVETEAWFGRMVTQEHRDDVQFAICPMGSREAIGNCGLRDIDRLHGSAEVSIAILAREQWGKGLGTDAMRAIVDYGFGELRLERIWLRVFDYNPRAIRSYEKVGFVNEVRLRRARFHRGQHHDVFLMAIIRPDWLAQDRKRSWDW